MRRVKTELKDFSLHCNCALQSAHFQEIHCLRHLMVDTLIANALTKRNAIEPDQTHRTYTFRLHLEVFKARSAGFAGGYAVPFPVALSNARASETDHQ